MFEVLKKLKYKTLPTLNRFILKTKDLDMHLVMKYTKFLSEKPKREDFIPYNSQGELIKDHKPKFKGWTVCPTTSDEKTKVAMKNLGDNNSCRIYFDTKEGVTIVSYTHMSDFVTYNELAIFFEGKLELN